MLTKLGKSLENSGNNIYYVDFTKVKILKTLKKLLEFSKHVWDNFKNTLRNSFSLGRNFTKL